jgi:hypothetical protein
MFTATQHPAFHSPGAEKLFLIVDDHRSDETLRRETSQQPSLPCKTQKRRSMSGYLLRRFIRPVT